MITTLVILALSALFFVNGKIRSDLVALCALDTLAETAQRDTAFLHGVARTVHPLLDLRPDFQRPVVGDVDLIQLPRDPVVQRERIFDNICHCVRFFVSSLRDRKSTRLNSSHSV